MSSESLMSNIQPANDIETHDKDYQNLEIEPSSKKKKIVLIVSILAAITIVIVTIVLCYVFFYKQKEQDSDDGYEFVYINDIHLDPLYVPDSSPLDSSNCRKSSGSGINHPFGQYGCDSPNSVFSSMINFLPKASTNPKFVLFGGDGPAHGLGYDVNGVRELNNWIVQNISSVYPNIPILFSLGNNDYSPNYGNNNFTGDVENFESMSRILAPFMNEDQQSTFKKGGYYYHDFPEMNLRLIIINSIIYNTYREVREDPYDQFSWIRTVSSDAKNKGYKIGASIHIPPGVSYNSSKLNQGWHEVYMKEFDEIVKEYDIQFIIAGHSHYDMIMPLYMPNGVSKSFSLSAPSISSQHKNNPAFRVIKISNGKLIDYVQYYADIMMNPQNELDWKVEYTFKDAYNAHNAGKSELLNIVDWIKTTGEGRWRYMEKICSLASDNGKFYYCVLTCTTEEEIRKCVQPLNSNIESFSRYFPYGGQR